MCGNVVQILKTNTNSTLKKSKMKGILTFLLPPLLPQIPGAPLELVRPYLVAPV